MLVVEVADMVKSSRWQRVQDLGLLERASGWQSVWEGRRADSGITVYGVERVEHRLRLHPCQPTLVE